jgi:Ca2+-binding EF-hand superfamily protein
MKAMTLLALAAAAGFAANAAAQASAQSDKRSATTLFERLDKNKDGFVTRDEARDAAELQGRFAELDVDNDGKISRQEMRALDAKPGAEVSSSGSTARAPADSTKTGKSR